METISTGCHREIQSLDRSWNLRYFWEPYKLDEQQVRWYLKLQDYNFILWYISGKTNTKADVLLRKDQVNIIEDNKNIKILKGKLWLRQVNMKTEVVVIRGSQVVEETILLEEIRRNWRKIIA